MKDLIALIIILIGIVFIIIINLKIKKGQLKLVETYSSKAVFKRSILFLFVVVIISLIIYLLSRSIEVTISLGAFLLMGVVASFIYGLLWENQTKGRGGRKVD
jgi:hypothetical protein